jgi:hypothetical protein
LQASVASSLDSAVQASIAGFFVKSTPQLCKFFVADLGTCRCTRTSAAFGASMAPTLSRLDFRVKT